MQGYITSYYELYTIQEIRKRNGAVHFACMLAFLHPSSFYCHSFVSHLHRFSSRIHSFDQNTMQCTKAKRVPIKWGMMLKIEMSCCAFRRSRHRIMHIVTDDSSVVAVHFIIHENTRSLICKHKFCFVVCSSHWHMHDAQ